MENIKSKIINVKGFDTHYLESGQGEPLIIVHGGGDGASAWKRNIAILSRHYRVYAPDLPGFGLSLTHLNSYSIPEVAEFVNQFAEAIGLKDYNLMGHSFGGGIAAHLALKYPQKVRKLVLVSSLCLGKEIAWWVRYLSLGPIMKIAGQAAILMFKGIKNLVHLFSDAVVRQPITAANVAIGTVISNFSQQTVVLLAQLPNLLVPTLVMWGGKDPIVPSSQAYTAGRLIPDCRVKVFANCGHSVYRDDIRGFSRELAGFLG